MFSPFLSSGRVLRGFVPVRRDSLFRSAPDRSYSVLSRSQVRFHLSDDLIHYHVERSRRLRRSLFDSCSGPVYFPVDVDVVFGLICLTNLLSVGSLARGERSCRSLSGRLLVGLTIHLPRSRNRIDSLLYVHSSASPKASWVDFPVKKPRMKSSLTELRADPGRSSWYSAFSRGRRERVARWTDFHPGH